MKKCILFVFTAAFLLAISPVWAQESEKPGCCSKSQQKQCAQTCTKEQQQQCTQTCSKDGKCMAKCPECGKECAATCSKDGKSCTATCPNCKKDFTTPCPGAAAGKAGCCSKDQAQTCKPGCTGEQAKVAPAGCSKDAQTTCSVSACTGQTMKYKCAAIPVMLYDVAGERLGCPKSAVAMAAEKNCTVKYVVDGKLYENKDEALAAQADVLDKYLNDTLSVKYAVGEQVTCCPKTAETLAKEKSKPMCYRLTGYKFNDQGEAEKAAKQARLAADSIEMKMMVGDKAYNCPIEAGEAAKQCGKEVDYCIGEMKTTSEVMAKIQLELARIKAAVDKIEECGGQPV